MELRPLSRTGVRVSALCLGSMTFGREADEATSAAIVDRFLDAGGNFVDTADVYGRGASEEIVGRAIKGRRDNIVLAAKGRTCSGPSTFANATTGSPSSRTNRSTRSYAGRSSKNPCRCVPRTTSR